MWEYLKILTMRACFQAKEPGMLPPYLGSTVRGILGHCIRESYCSVSDKKCFQCENRFNCRYVSCFSNTGKEYGAVNPYTIHVFQNGKTQWNRGDECIFDLTLFGTATESAEVYLDAILQMERKGFGASRLPFKLVYISEARSGKLIYANGRTFRYNLKPCSLETEGGEAKSVLVSFDTPLRIVSGKELCQVPSFYTLIRFLTGRLLLLSQIYAGYKIEWNEKLMEEQAKNVRITASDMRKVDFVRYSINRDDGKLELPSMMGWMYYEGDLSFLTPVLEAGKYTHVGRGATIGFGHYETFYDK